MYPQHLSNYVITESQSLSEALWKFEKQRYVLDNAILVVLDKENHYMGIITRGMRSGDGGLNAFMYLENPLSKTVGEICNRNAKYCRDGQQSRESATVIFADNSPNINAIPVIDDNGNLTDIIFRQQIFYKDFYNEQKLPRMHYANQIYSAAELAKKLGYSAFSVIEFGVAGGNGLVNCEFHAKEISRILGINIEVYGFDTGAGLPKTDDIFNACYIWKPGFYVMDYDALQQRLQFAQLVIGDINQTAHEFMQSRNFAPIGTMLVDVDYYSSTVPILNMLHGATEKFLPRVYMYFDDIGEYLEHLGERLAIDEFNNSSEDVKVSKWQPSYWGRNALWESIWIHHLFCAHLFRHKKYEENPRKSASINLI